MIQNLGTIKIKGDKIITKKDGLKETWTIWGGDENYFLIYHGVRYNLLKSETI